MMKMMKMMIMMVVMVVVSARITGEQGEFPRAQLRLWTASMSRRFRRLGVVPYIVFLSS